VEYRVNSGRKTINQRLFYPAVSVFRSKQIIFALLPEYLLT
jgi:hypothetical protein